MLTSWEPCTQINSLSASVSGKSQRHSTIRRPVDIEKKPCEAQSMAIPRCSHHIKATTHAENQLAGLSVSEEPASSQLVHSGADRFPVSLPEKRQSALSASLSRQATDESIVRATLARIQYVSSSLLSSYQSQSDRSPGQLIVIITIQVRVTVPPVIPSLSSL